MKPSSFRICTMPTLTREAGIEMRFFLMRFALRIRVNRSLIGSVIMVGSAPLPGGLAHAGDLAAVRGVAQADAADAELAVDRALAAAHRAAGVGARLELRLALLLDDPGGLRHGSALLLSGALRLGLLRGERHPELLQEPVPLLVVARG